MRWGGAGGAFWMGRKCGRSRAQRGGVAGCLTSFVCLEAMFSCFVGGLFGGFWFWFCSGGVFFVWFNFVLVFFLCDAFC